jgi:hypothetical protein
MSLLDRFASAFKSAAKTNYVYAPVELQKISIFSDFNEDAASLYGADIRTFLGGIEARKSLEWDHHTVAKFHDVGDLLEEIERDRADLVCTYRNVGGKARSFPFSLGSYVDVLTQATTTPLLLMPAPNASGRLPAHCERAARVMVLTDHLTGSDALINYGLHFCEAGGSLVLAHLEDDVAFDRYIDIVGKIPAIDTDLARDRIYERLLQEPADYIDSVASALAGKEDIEVVKEVSMGHRIADCQRLIEKHSIDLLVMNTKDDDQLAMHGLAYPLAIELRNCPILMF